MSDRPREAQLTEEQAEEETRAQARKDALHEEAERLLANGGTVADIARLAYRHRIAWINDEDVPGERRD